MKKLYIAVIAALIAVNAAGGAARAESAKAVWEKINAKLAEVKDYTCILNTFNIDTPTAIKYKPKASDGRPYTEKWDTLKLEMTWKEPGYMYAKVDAADNPGLELAARQIKKKPGTQVVFGYKDKTDIYGKFPKSGDPALDKQIEKHIFHMPFVALESPHAIFGYNQSVKTIMAYFGRYFSKGKVTLDQAPMPAKKNISFNTATKAVDFSVEKSERPFYRFTMVPNSVADNGGITKEILYVNPTSLFPAQIESYEGDRLVSIMNIEDLQVNAGIDDSLWVNYFKGAQMFSPNSTMK
jgi:outer membrane lipoprotein-sorting protein